MMIIGVGQIVLQFGIIYFCITIDWVTDRKALAEIALAFLLMAIRRITALITINIEEVPEWLHIIDRVLLPCLITLLLFHGFSQLWKYNPCEDSKKK